MRSSPPYAQITDQQASSCILAGCSDETTDFAMQSFREAMMDLRGVNDGGLQREMLVAGRSLQG